MSKGSKPARGRTRRRPWGDLIVFAGLLAAVCGTAVSIVRTAHESRALNHELAQLEQQADLSRIEYDRLLLEQSAWSGQGRITRIAEQELAMEAPDPFAIVIVE